MSPEARRPGFDRGVLNRLSPAAVRHGGPRFGNAKMMAAWNDGCIHVFVPNIKVRRALSSVRSKKLEKNVNCSPLWTVHPSRELYERGLALHDRYGFSFYDSMIVVGAVESGCVRIYSEDLQHGQRIQSLTIEDPFRA